MPLILVTTPADTLDAAARQRLAAGLTAAAIEVEQIGPRPDQQARTIVLFSELSEAGVFLGGAPAPAGLGLVSIQFRPPAGVLDAAARDRAVTLCHAAAVDTLGEGTFTSVIIDEVPDGHWGANGATLHLADFARAAGYAHLQHLVA